MISRTYGGCRYFVYWSLGVVLMPYGPIQNRSLLTRFYYLGIPMYRPAPSIYSPLAAETAVTALLLYCCTAILLMYCSTVLLLYWCTTLLMYCSSDLMLNCSIAVLHSYSVPTLLHFLEKVLCFSTIVLLSFYTTVLLHVWSTPMFYCSTVLLFYCSTGLWWILLQQLTPQTYGNTLMEQAKFQVLPEYLMLTANQCK